MAFNPPKGPGKGPGNGSPKAKPFTSEQAKAASDKATVVRQAESFVRRQMREWNAANPDAVKAPETLSKNAIKHILSEGSPDALQRLHDEILDSSSAKGVEASKIWLEHAQGRPTQAVDLNATISKAKPATNEEAMAEIAELSEALGLKYQLVEVVEEDDPEAPTEG